MNLLKETLVSRLVNATAAGTTNITPAHGVDMSNYDGVLFICAMGALTATQVTKLKAQQSNDDGVSDAYADIAGAETAAAADADGNKLLILDVYKPLKRYVLPIVERATANAAIDSVTAIQYRGRRLPPQDSPVGSGTSQSLFVVGS